MPLPSQPWPLSVFGMACQFDFVGEAEVLDGQAVQSRISALCSDLSARKGDPLAADLLRRFAAAVQDEEGYVAGREREDQSFESRSSGQIDAERSQEAPEGTGAGAM